jgi:hypothetical protein
MTAYVQTFRVVAVLLAFTSVTACNRESGSSSNPPLRSDTDDSARSAAAQRERQDDINKLNERVTKLDREYAEKTQKLATGRRTASTGLRDEVKEDVSNVKRAVEDLSTTTPENWWERHEQALERTADDIEADVRRMAGKSATVRPSAGAGTGTKGDTVSAAPFTSRRDAFVNKMRLRIDAMQDALKNVKATGTRETERDDTRARLKKVDDDLDRLSRASADDWWNVSKARVTDYVERVEGSVGRLDDNKR